MKNSINNAFKVAKKENRPALISFNKDLYRIGYGGGYYDRTLAKLLNNKSRPKFFGISYDFQLTECKFESKFDVRLDKVITDKKVYV